MLRFRTFLFDLDGTLIDHFAAIHRCHSHTMRQLGLPAPTLAQVRAAVGGGLENAIARLAGPERVAEAVKIYRPYWDATLLDGVSLLPGARELLDELHASGAKLAVLTNKLGASSRLICEHLGIASSFVAIVGASDTPWLKPAPELMEHTLRQIQAEAKDTLLVGDSPYDVQAAHRGGLPCWCVTTGTHTAAELQAAKADAVFADLTELQAALFPPGKRQARSAHR